MLMLTMTMTLWWWRRWWWRGVCVNRRRRDVDGDGDEQRCRCALILYIATVRVAAAAANSNHNADDDDNDYDDSVITLWWRWQFVIRRDRNVDEDGDEQRPNSPCCYTKPRSWCWCWRWRWLYDDDDDDDDDECVSTGGAETSMETEMNSALLSSMLPPALPGSLPVSRPGPIYSDCYSYGHYSDPYMTSAKAARPGPYARGVEYSAYSPRVKGLYPGANNFGYTFESRWLFGIQRLFCFEGLYIVCGRLTNTLYGGDEKEWYHVLITTNCFCFLLLFFLPNKSNASGWGYNIEQRQTEIYLGMSEQLLVRLK